MDEKKFLKRIEGFAKRLPKFPDGRINYKKASSAPIVLVFVKYRNEFLLLKRSNAVLTYKGKWDTVAGYLDEVVPLKKKALEELKEETGIEEQEIKSIKFRKSDKIMDKKIRKTWLRHPVLIELKRKPKIKLSREHTDFRWIKPDGLKKFDSVKGLETSLKSVL